jgi:hypothetical protein
MIGPDTYNASFYAMAAPPPMAGRKDAVEDAAAAADFARILNQAAPVNAAAPAASSAAAPESGDTSFLGFVKTIADVINPLQHIPLVGALYRHITGDEINPMARLAGDTLYGGPIGAAFAAVDIGCQKITGHDMGETVIAALTKDKNNAPADDVMIAQNLNDHVLPAAGGPQISDIIWSTPAENNSPVISSLLSPTPPLQRSTGTNEEEPAVHSTPAPVPPVLQAKDTQVASTTVLQPHEAPAVSSRTDVPPALIAARMMEALDKYQQMKSTGLTPMPMMSQIY